MFIVAPLLLLATAANAAILSLQTPRLTVTSSDGSTFRSEPLSFGHKISEPITLAAKDTLKITFQTIDADSGKGVQPQQTFLRFYDTESGEEGIQPLRVTNGGKAKFELNMAKPPLSFPATGAAPVKVTLILGHSGYTPISRDIFDLYVPASYPVTPHPDEASFHPLPIIEHTFRPDPKQPPKLISAVAAALVLVPWVVLLGLWGQISPKAPRLFSPRILPFTITLGAFEALLVWYWVALKLGDVLLYGAILGVITLFTGQYALSSISERRLATK